MAANIGSFVIPPGESIQFAVVANGGFPPGFEITFVGGETGVKTLIFGPIALPAGGTFALFVTPSDGIITPVAVSAVLEIE